MEFFGMSKENNFLVSFSKLQKQPPKCFVQKVVFENFTRFTGKHLCWGLLLIKLQAWKPATLLKKNPARVSSCEYCKICKSNYFEEHLRTAVSSNCRSDAYLGPCQISLMESFVIIITYYAQCYPRIEPSELIWTANQLFFFFLSGKSTGWFLYEDNTVDVKPVKNTRLQVSDLQDHYVFTIAITQSAFTCFKSTNEEPEECVKFA